MKLNNSFSIQFSRRYAAIFCMNTRTTSYKKTGKIPNFATVSLAESLKNSHANWQRYIKGLSRARMKAPRGKLNQNLQNVKLLLIWIIILKHNPVRMLPGVIKYFCL